MTSQIAIFNPLGVAVASDTVTTLTTEGGVKTTNNAEKMWPLVGGHLVVVAVSGSVNSNGIHSRLLIAEWNRSLNDPMASLQDYAESFSTWLSREENLIPIDSEIGELHYYLNNHYYYIRAQVIEEAQELPEEEIPRVFKEHTELGLEYLKSLPLFEGVSDEADAELLAKRGIDLDDKIDYIFKDFPGLDEVRELLKESAPLILSRAQPMPNDTDLAFIGFGSSEHFAQSIKLTCRGRYGGHARVAMGDPFGASATNSSGSIQTFAQSDAIFGFIRGAQHQVLDQAFEFTWDFVVSQFENSDDGVAKAREVIDGMRKHVHDYMFESFAAPLLDTVGALNLKDAADLAESLVGIQAMRANASPEPPGVGGFIESLIIDRFDGIRWVKQLPR
jgi:hypothetical protein